MRLSRVSIKMRGKSQNEVVKLTFAVRCEDLDRRSLKILLALKSQKKCWRCFEGRWWGSWEKNMDRKNERVISGERTR